MASKSRKGRGSSSVNVDLSGVETTRKAIPEGTYTVVVSEVTQKESQSGNPTLAFTFEVDEGAHKGAKLFENCSLQPQALFKLKTVLMALGMNIPNKAFDLNLKDLIGLTCEVEVGHEVYEGKKRSRILEYISSDESDESDDDEDEDDDDDSESIEDKLSELDLDELKELAQELDLPNPKIKKAKKAKALINLIVDNSDEDDILEALEDLTGDDDDDDDDDEDDQDYSEMSLSELKAECKNRGLKVKKSMDQEDLIEMLEEDDEE